MEKRMNKKFLLKSLIITLSLIGFIWFVFAAAPDSPSSPNYPADGATGIEINPVLNVTVTDPDSDTVNVSFYQGITSWDINEASYDSVSISTQYSYPKGLFFKSDGTKLYETGVNGIFGGDGRTHQYSCSDAWNLSNCSYDSVYISTEDGNPTGMFFKSDGTKLYELSMDMIYQHNCSDAWNLSSCSYENINISPQSWSSGLFFKSDGTKLYEAGTYESDGTYFGGIYQYTCSDAWNLSSCSYDSIFITTEENDPQGLFFKSDGTKLYEVEYSWQKIHQYSCTTEWDLSTCSYDSIYISTQDSQPSGLFFKSDGTKLYEIGQNGDKIYQYSISDNLLNISTNVTNNSYANYTWSGLSTGTTYKWFVNVTDGTDTTQSSEWNFTTSYTPVLENYNLTPDSSSRNDNLTFNITCTNREAGETITGYLQIYNGTVFGSVHSSVISNNTETTLYTLDSGNTSIGEIWTGEFWCGDDYSNSTKQNDSVAIQNTLPSISLNYPSNSSTGIGTDPVLNVTVTDAENHTMDVSFYKSLSWIILNSSYDNINISTQDSIPTGMFFKSDGTKLYEIGKNGDKIYQYTCSNAWDLSSCSYDNVNISALSTDYPEGLFFKSDGTKLYEIGGSGSYPIQTTYKIYQYTCSDAWNLSSCSSDGVYILVQENTHDATGMFFKSDGTKLYEIGAYSSKFYQYTCSDAWNLSSCSYDSVYISTEDGNPTGMFFKSDGTKLYEIGIDGDKIYRYSCSDAWNLSSCSYDNINISTQDSSPSGLFFSSDGTKIYEIGYNGDKIYQYSIADLLNTTTTDVINGSYVTYTWSGLSDQTYNWFVKVTDGLNTTLSSTWSFTVITTAGSSNNGNVGVPSSLGNLINKRILSLTENGYVTFTYEQSEHKIKIIEVGKNYATFLISSTPTNFTLNIGESKNIDLDNDGKTEIKITLTKIFYESAYFILEPYEERIEKETTAEGEEEKEFEEGNFVWLVILLILAIIIVINKIKAKKKK